MKYMMKYKKNILSCWCKQSDPMLLILSFILFGLITGISKQSLAQAQDQSVAVCHTLTKYKKVNDVAYTPGVDVNGNAVVPADANAPVTIIQNVTKVPLTIDLARRLSGLNVAGLQMDADFGMLEIHPDGRVIYGDQDWTSDVKTICGIPHEVEKQKPVEKTQEKQTIQKEVGGNIVQAEPVKISPVDNTEPVEVQNTRAVPPKDPKPVAKQPEQTTKIITNWPELIPNKIQGGAYRE